MRNSKVTPEQILQALRQAESGPGVVDICRDMGATADHGIQFAAEFCSFGVTL